MVHAVCALLLGRAPALTFAFLALFLGEGMDRATLGVILGILMRLVSLLAIDVAHACTAFVVVAIRASLDQVRLRKVDFRLLQAVLVQELVEVGVGLEQLAADHDLALVLVVSQTLSTIADLLLEVQSVNFLLLLVVGALRLALRVLQQLVAVQAGAHVLLRAHQVLLFDILGRHV